MTLPTSIVYFFYQNVKLRIENRTGLKLYIESIFKKEKRKLGSINFIFCTDKALLQINKQFLKHDFYTDIITFDLSDKPGTIDAEIYISVDRVRENAKAHQTSFKEELHRVIFHGVLHLCGYGDKTAKQSLEMRGREDGYLKKYQIRGST